MPAARPDFPCPLSCSRGCFRRLKFLPVSAFYAAPIAQVLAEVFVCPREILSFENFILSSENFILSAENSLLSSESSLLSSENFLSYELYEAAELSLCNSEFSFVFRGK